jgi:hypothetical protein
VAEFVFSILAAARVFFRSLSENAREILARSASRRAQMQTIASPTDPLGSFLLDRGRDGQMSWRS